MIQDLYRLFVSRFGNILESSCMRDTILSPYFCAHLAIQPLHKFSCVSNFYVDAAENRAKSRQPAALNNNKFILNAETASQFCIYKAL